MIVTPEKSTKALLAYALLGSLDPAVAAIMDRLDPTWRFAKRDMLWLRMLSELDAHIVINGDARVPQSSGALLMWVANQRARYRAGELSAERVRQLEARAGWTWAPHDAAWAKFMSLMVVFVAAHGHARVPNKEGDDDEKLGQSVVIQRMAYRRGTLSAERIAELEAFDGWCWDAREQSFQDGLAAYLAYVEREGHPQIPREHWEGTIPLGKWMKQRRKEYRDKKIKAHYIVALENSDQWSWDPHDQWFEDALTILKRYAARTGTARLPLTHIEEGFRLGSWASARRTDYRDGRLSAERVAALEALPGWAWVLSRARQTAASS
jgi:hypothetical protein